MLLVLYLLLIIQTIGIIHILGTRGKCAADTKRLLVFCYHCFKNVLKAVNFLSGFFFFSFSTSFYYLGILHISSTLSSTPSQNVYSRLTKSVYCYILIIVLEKLKVEISKQVDLRKASLRIRQQILKGNKGEKSHR